MSTRKSLSEADESQIVTIRRKNWTGYILEESPTLVYWVILRADQKIASNPPATAAGFSDSFIVSKARMEGMFDILEKEEVN